MIRRRGFTLIEMMVAGIMAAIVLGGVTTALSQLGSAKSISRHRLEAFSRCDTALRTIRRDIISVLRRSDLFDTRLLLNDFSGRFQGREVSLDEMLIFNGNLRANKEIDFNGEGFEYETQFRIEPNNVSSALWKRRDAILDDNPIGGGMATPIAEGIVSLQFEAFDGMTWFGQWDSDELGIPRAIRVTIESTGMNYVGDDNSPSVSLRTVIPLDRVRSPYDRLEYIAMQQEEELGLGGTGDGEGLELDLDSSGAGGGGRGGGSGSSGGKDSSSGGGDSGTTTGSKSGTTIIDPDGNEHDIPPSP